MATPDEAPKNAAGSDAPAAIETNGKSNTDESSSKKKDESSSRNEEAAKQQASKKQDKQQLQVVAEEVRLHPDSKYQEPYSGHASTLTLYDLHRIPRPVKSDAAKLTIPLTSALKSEFTCPICLSYLKKTAIVMECLHRFCNDCIQKCLRLSPRKECPSCRIHIPTRRSLRPDPEFDLLLKHVLGDVDELLKKEEERQSILAEEARKRGDWKQQWDKRLKTSHNIAASTGKRLNKRSRVQRDVIRPAAIRTAPEVPEAVLIPETDLSDMKHLPLVQIMLMRHTAELYLPHLMKNFLTLNENVTVGLLQRFLQKKLSTEREILILLKYQGSFCVLQDQMTVRDVCTYFATGSQVTLLRYTCM